MQKCATAADLDFDDLLQCTKTDESIDLLHNHAIDTLALEPKLTFVPWIIFNRVIFTRNN